MKLEGLVFFILLVLLTFSWDVLAQTPAATPTKAEKVRQKAGETVEATKELTVEQKQKVQKEFSDSIKDLEKQIASLKKDMEKVSGGAKQDLQNKIADLEKQEDSLKKDLAELSTSTGRAWSQLKQGMSSALDDLKTAFKKAKAEYSEKK